MSSRIKTTKTITPPHPLHFPLYPPTSSDKPIPTICDVILEDINAALQTLQEDQATYDAQIAVLSQAGLTPSQIAQGTHGIRSQITDDEGYLHSLERECRNRGCKKCVPETSQNPA